MPGIPQRVAVWVLAASSFACLLGHFYGLWTMRWFACWALPPATLLLMVMAWRARGQPRGAGNAHTWIVHGAIAGLVAALAYDLFRLPFVLAGYPLYGVFPRFGQLLLERGAGDVGAAVQVTGWLYHFSNAAALGIMFLAMVARWRPATLVGGAVAWAAGVEVLLLLTPYYGFFKLDLPYPVFLALTLSAHLVFGIALGLWCWLRLERPAQRTAAA